MIGSRCRSLENTAYSVAVTQFMAFDKIMLETVLIDTYSSP